MNRRLAFCVLPLVLAACLSNDAENGFVGPLPTAPAVQPATGNLTGCRGHFATVLVDETTVEGFVPSNYNPRTGVPEVVYVGVWALECAKVAVAGVDRGPAWYFMIDVPIESPSENPPPPGYAAAFLLDFGSNVSNLANLASRISEATRLVDLSLEDSELTNLYGSVSGVVRENNTELYTWSGVPAESSTSYSLRLRLYGSGGFEAPVIDLDSQVEETVNDGPGQFNGHARTTLGSALPQGRAEAIVSRAFSFDAVLAVQTHELARD